jgi:hypothetical protein
VREDFLRVVAVAKALLLCQFDFPPWTPTTSSRNTGAPHSATAQNYLLQFGLALAPLNMPRTELNRCHAAIFSTSTGGVPSISANSPVLTLLQSSLTWMR